MAKKNKIIIMAITILFIAMIVFEVKTDFWKMEICKMTKGGICFGTEYKLCKLNNIYCYTDIVARDAPGARDGMTLEERKKRSQEIYDRAERLKKLKLEEYSEEEK